jgi:hypothetical protein
MMMDGTAELVPQPVAALPAAASPMELIARAVSSGATPETLDKLLTLQQRWEADEARKIFSEAMTLAQAEMRPVSADASNSQTKSRYASYHALDGALRPIYSKHGFSLSFDTADGAPESHVRIVCFLSHKTGHTRPYHVDMPSDGKGAKGNDVMTKTHAVGAAVTYGRRYLLTMIFNIAIGDDTDGNTRAELIEGSNTITPDEFIFIRELIETHGADEALVLKAVNATDLETMTQKQYREAVSRLKAWVKKKAVG